MGTESGLFWNAHCQVPSLSKGGCVGGSKIKNLLKRKSSC